MSETDAINRETLLCLLADYPDSSCCPNWPDNPPEKEIAWASSLIQAYTFNEASRLNAYSALMAKQHS